MFPCISYQNSCLVTENTDIVTDISCQSVMFKNLVWKVSVGLYLKDEGAVATLYHGGLAINVLTTRATVPHSSMFKFCIREMSFSSKNKNGWHIYFMLWYDLFKAFSRLLLFDVLFFCVFRKGGSI